jgi:antitoxin HigA-1
MLMTKRKPASVGEILVAEFMEPLGLTQGDLAKAMGVPRKHVNELCNDRRAITADTALMLARVFGNSADFWLNVQRRNDLWEALHSPDRRQRIERARPPHEACLAQRLSLSGVPKNRFATRSPSGWRMAERKGFEPLIRL